MKKFIFLILFIGLIYAQDVTAALRVIYDSIQLVLPLLALTMVIFAATIYVLGSIGDSQIRARSTVWANAFITSAVLAIILYIFFSSFFQGLFAYFPALIVRYRDMVLITALCVAGVVSIVYAISKITNNPEWQAYWGIELSQLVASALILFFAVGFFEVARTFASDVTYEFTLVPGQPGVFYTSAPIAASKFMERILLRNIFPAVNDLFKIQVCLSHLNTFQRRIGEYVLTLTYKLFPAVDSIISVTNVIVFGFVAILGSVSTQIAILNLIDVLMVSFFLPAGIVLRFLPPTRQAGIFLIALAIGFQAVFPLTYIINIKTLALMGFNDYNPPYSVLGLCGGDLALLGLAGNIPTFGIANPLTSLVGMSNTLIKTIFSEFTIGLIRPLEFASFMQDISYLSLVALFMPAFSTTITFAFINAFTKFINMKM